MLTIRGTLDQQATGATKRGHSVFKPASCAGSHQPRSICAPGRTPRALSGRLPRTTCSRSYRCGSSTCPLHWHEQHIARKSGFESQVKGRPSPVHVDKGGASLKQDEDGAIEVLRVAQQAIAVDKHAECRMDHVGETLVLYLGVWSSRGRGSDEAGRDAQGEAVAGSPNAEAEYERNEQKHGPWRADQRAAKLRARGLHTTIAHSPGFFGSAGCHGTSGGGGLAGKQGTSAGLGERRLFCSRTNVQRSKREEIMCTLPATRR